MCVRVCVKLWISHFLCMTQPTAVGLAASLDRVKPQTVGTNRFIPPELLDSPDEDGVSPFSVVL